MPTKSLKDIALIKQGLLDDDFTDPFFSHFGFIDKPHSQSIQDKSAVDDTDCLID